MKKRWKTVRRVTITGPHSCDEFNAASRWCADHGYTILSRGFRADGTYLVVAEVNVGKAASAQADKEGSNA